MNIVVLAGGTSTERDISIMTSVKVCESLRRNGHNANIIDVFFGIEDKAAETFFNDNGNDLEKIAADMKKKDILVDDELADRKKSGKGFFGDNVLALCLKADIVFMGLHGSNGEDGKIQAVFELMGIKYTGTDYISSAISMSKELTKKVLVPDGIPMPKGVALKKGHKIEYVPYPCVVKPCCGGSSVGVYIANDQTEYEQALKDAYSYEDEVVIEEYIKGREFSVAVVDGKAYPIIEIAPIQGFYDYKNKYQAGSTIETCPAEISPELTEKMQHYAEAGAKVLFMEGYCRLDFMMKENGDMYCLEANTLPPDSSGSESPGNRLSDVM